MPKQTIQSAWWAAFEAGEIDWLRAVLRTEAEGGSNPFRINFVRDLLHGNGRLRETPIPPRDSIPGPEFVAKCGSVGLTGRALASVLDVTVPVVESWKDGGRLVGELFPDYFGNLKGPLRLVAAIELWHGMDHNGPVVQ